MVPWNGPRAKVQIKLSIQRLRTLQEKKLALAKASRRDIADLLSRGRVETARLRTEGMIQDDIYVELLEVIELYAEMLQARFNLLEASNGPEPDPSIADAVCAIVYAAPRTELKELQVLREILMHKFGRAFSLTLQPSDPPPSSVPSRILSKLSLFTPSKELVDAYLGEIARGYGVPWTPEFVPESETEGIEDGNGVKDGGSEEDRLEPLKRSGGEDEDSTREGDKAEKDEVGTTTKSTPPLDKDTEKSMGKSEKDKKGVSPTKPASTLPPPPTSTAPAIAAPAKKLTEEEELAQRFERLKNLR